LSAGRRWPAATPFTVTTCPIEIPENLATEAYTTYWGAAANGWPHWAPLAIREPCCRR
jgi:hypothetical protein